MENRNFKNFTVQDLMNKMKKLRQKYKQEKDKSRRSGTGRRKKWKFFEIMDRTLCNKPQVKPPLVIDSSASSTAELPETVNDVNSEISKFSFLVLMILCCFFHLLLCIVNYSPLKPKNVKIITGICLFLRGKGLLHSKLLK